MFVSDISNFTTLKDLEAAISENVEGADTLVAGLESHLYVVELMSHGIKVGQSRQPAQRVRSHATTAKGYGLSVGRIAISPPTADANDLEQMLIKGCEAIATPYSREFFPISFDDALPVLESLPLYRGDAETHHRKNEATFNMFKSVVLGTAGGLGGAR